MTTKSYNAELSDPIIACVVYAIQNAHQAGSNKKGKHFDILKNNLSLALLGIANIQQSTCSGWYADEHNPGFLVKQSGSTFVRVPAHLVRLFPDQDTLNKIWKLGADIKTSETSILHVSGSNAVKAVFSYINDIDFCEYTGEKPSKIAQSIIDIVSRSDNSACCIKVRIADADFVNPFSLDDIRSEASSLCHDKADRSTFKMDYLVDPDWSERPYEISNVGITCKYIRGNLQSMGFAKTFAYQQAQIAATDLVPTVLDDPDEAGRYALWLIGEVNKYKRSSDALKMLKRLLSLVRFFYLRDLTLKFDHLFENSTILIKAELNEVERLLKFLQTQTQKYSTVNRLEGYRSDLLVQFPIYEKKEQKFFSDGVSLEAYNLLKITAEMISNRSGGVLKL